jgi:hypothetical protein
MLSTLVTKLTSRRTNEALYGYLFFALAMLTIATWFVPCTVTSVVASGIVALAVLGLGSVAIRRLTGKPPIHQSVGSLMVGGVTTYFIFFGFVYAVEWLLDEHSLTWEGRRVAPRLGEMFLVSLGVAAGGANVATVHDAARITAYVEKLLLVSTALAGVALAVNGVRTYLTRERHGDT